MPLRLLELTVSNQELGHVLDLLQDTPAAHIWTSETSNDSSLIRILVDAEHVESVSDSVFNRLGSRDDFRLIVLPVEATIPSVEKKDEKEITEGITTESVEDSLRRISREELYEDLATASRLTPIYLTMVALSTVVAAVGLIRGDLAIVIGAMVIAPLLGPNIALSLACTLGDPNLAKRSLKAVGAGFAIAVVLSTILGALLEIDPNASELANRTRPDFGDIILALAAGTAGSLAFTTGVPAVVVGVMVAVALLPPIVVAGLLAGAGYVFPAGGALMLLVTNVTCLNLAAISTFLLQKVRPRTWWEAERAKQATRLAVGIWVAMLFILLGLMILI